MNGCIYRTKSGECSMPNKDKNYGPLCRSDCKDKHPSNADIIRAKSDEDLAFALTWSNTIIPPWCAEHIECPYMGQDHVPCYKCAAEWLEQEAT